MRDLGIVHPELMTRIQPNFYPSLCTIQQDISSERSGFGEPVPEWVDLPNHVDLPCRISPRSKREVRSEDQAYAEATHTVALNGYYPDIDEAMCAVVDGVTYQIDGSPEHDGNRKTTRLQVRIVDGEG